MVKTPAAPGIIAPLSLRPPVAEGPGVLVVTVKLEARELAELMREEREEREEERSVDEDSDDVPEVVDDDNEDDDNDDDDDDDEPSNEEVGGCSEVTEGRAGTEVGLFKQTSELPAPTVITGVALPSPLESPRTITMLVPAGIVT